MNKRKGFTLIELIVSISVVMILASIGVPVLASFIVELRVDNEISSICRLLFITRNTAINENKTVTLCPLNNQNICENQWQNTLSVFIDSNNNKIYEPATGERLIKVKPPIFTGDILQYGNTRNGLTYSATGHLSCWGQNATFKYCPKNYNEKSRGIVVAVSGRIYTSSDDNNTQVDKNRSGVTITCT
ncbi:MAG: type IV fimbrial biogenesis protein FimT [Alteromonadaceae bacterium]|jgi:type IV fimbrial biogenesis protein FimT